MFYLFDNNGRIPSLLLQLDQHDYLLGDFHDVYYPAAQALRAGTPAPAGFFYSPFFLILVTPFSYLPYESAAFLWGLLGAFVTALYFGTCVGVAKGNALRAIAYAFVVISSMPLLSNLRWGQLSVLLTMLAIWAVRDLAIGRHMRASCSLAICIALKYYGILLLPLFIRAGKPRSIVCLLLLLILLLAIVPLLILGPSAASSWYASAYTSLKQAKASWIAEHLNSQYFGHVLGRTFGPALLSDFTQATLRICAWIIALICYAKALALARLTGASAALRALCLVLLTTPFLVETSWPHYFAYLPFVHATLLSEVSQLPKSARARLLTCAGVISVVLASWPLCLLVGGWMPYNNAGLLFWANSLALISLLILPTAKDSPHQGPAS